MAIQDTRGRNNSDGEFFPSRDDRADGFDTVEWGRQIRAGLRQPATDLDEDSDGNAFKLFPWEHVVIAYAYDESGISVSDPGTGSLEHFTREWFLDAWGVLDGIAPSVSAGQKHRHSSPQDMQSKTRLRRGISPLLVCGRGDGFSLS